MQLDKWLLANELATIIARWLFIIVLMNSNESETSSFVDELCRFHTVDY